MTQLVLQRHNYYDRANGLKSFASHLASLKRGTRASKVAGKETDWMRKANNSSPRQHQLRVKDH